MCLSKTLHRGWFRSRFAFSELFLAVQTFRLSIDLPFRQLWHGLYRSCPGPDDCNPFILELGHGWQC